MSSDNSIELEGSLGAFVFKLKSSGPMAWFVALSAVALVGYIVIRYGDDIFKKTPEAAAKGWNAAMEAGTSFELAGASVLAGATGFSVLRKLNEYDAFKRADGVVVLTKKSTILKQ